MSREWRGGFGVLRTALPLSTIAIEFCWVYPWILLLTGAFYGPVAVPLLPSLAAFALLALGYTVVRVVLAQPWPLVRARVAVVAAGIIAGLYAVKLTYYPGEAAYDLRWIIALMRSAHDALPVVLPSTMGALTATLLWWRGVVLGEREFTHFEVDRAFRRGVGWTIAFVILFVLYGDTRGFAVAQSAPTYLLGFFSLSLVMLAVTRLLTIWEESQADETQALAANRHWLLLLVAVVGLILSGAAFISGLLSIQFRPVMLQALRPLEPVVEVIFLAVFAVALVIAKAIVFVISRLPWRLRGIEAPGRLDQPLSALLRDLPPTVVSSARWGIVLLVVALLVLLVAIAVVRARRKARKAGDDERESVWDPQSLLAGLGNAWRSLWARFQSVPSEADLFETSAIRAIYRDLLRLGTRHGVSRKTYETPFEYQPRLTSALPDGAADIATLTDAYTRVRYSPHRPGPDEVTDAKSALDRVRDIAGPRED